MMIDKNMDALRAEVPTYVNNVEHNELSYDAKT